MAGSESTWRQLSDVVGALIRTIETKPIAVGLPRDETKPGKAAASR
jgi:hypothetical protein